MFRSKYSKFAKWFCKKGNKLAIDLILTLTAAYYSLKKYFGWSFSNWVSVYFTPDGVPWVTIPFVCVVVYGVIGKTIMLVAEAFPGSRVQPTEQEGLNHCCLRINNEIARHIESVNSAPETAISQFTVHHSFDLNVANVIQSLADHLKSTLVGTAKNKDIFISVYQVPNFWNLAADRTTLSYVAHFHPDRDLVQNQIIDLNANGPFKNYECVKCVLSKEDTRCCWDCVGYEKTKAKRHKTVEHYIGMKIRCNGVLLGFLNIEMHNKRFFTSESEMEDYVESQLVAFRYLLEYQFLKKVFFHSVAQNLLNRKVEVA